MDCFIPVILSGWSQRLLFRLSGFDICCAGFNISVFVLCEKFMGATVGKSLMYLQVRSKNGAKISWPQAIVRNLTKIYWVPIVFDWLIGKLLKTDRILNNITRTIVIDEG